MCGMTVFTIMRKNETYNWLKSNGSYVNTQKIANDLDCRVDTEWLKAHEIHKAVNWLAEKHVNDILRVRKELPPEAISQNAFDINIKQYERLQKYKENLKFLAHDRRCFSDPEYDKLSTDLQQYTISKNIVNFSSRVYPREKMAYYSTLKTRKLVLYYRGARQSDPDDFGCDLFQFAFIYRCIQKLIKSNTLSVFNDVVVVSRTSWLPKQLYNIVPDVNLLKGFNETFLANTCLFSNTIHFYGGELPDAWLFNVPITGALYDIIDYGKQVPNRTSLPFLNYSGTISSEGEYILDDENEHIVNKEWVSWKKIVNNISTYGLDNKNDSTYNILYGLCVAIDSTEKLLLDDNINYDHVK